jgi:oligoribonuclease
LVRFLYLTQMLEKGSIVLGIFLDSETNGLNAYKHKVVEIAFKIIDVGTGELKDQYESIVFQTYDDWQLSDLESLQVNGFDWDQVSYGQKTDTVSQQIKDLFAKNNIQRGSSVFICQNPSFDRAFFSQLVDPETPEKLLWPYHWLDLASMHWATSMQKGKKDPAAYPWETGYSKDKIAKTYNLPSEKKPHRAMNGVDHLILCYGAVVGFPFQSNS